LPKIFNDVGLMK